MNFFRRNKGPSTKANGGVTASGMSVMIDDAHGLFDDNAILNIGDGMAGTRKEVPVTQEAVTELIA